MFVSIIIPCYKTAATMRQTIDSAISQGENAEVIVVNDGSPDDTEAIAKEYGDKIVYLSQQNAGVAAARNLGIKQAKGDFVYFLDADDTATPGMVESFRAFHLENPEIDVIYSNWNFADNDLQNWQTIEVVELPLVPLREELIKNQIMPVAAFHRTECVRQVGMMDSNLNGVDDWDLWIRLAAAGCKFKKAFFVSEAHRFRDNSQSKQFFQNWSGYRRILQKHAALYSQHLTKQEQQGVVLRFIERDIKYLYGNDTSLGWAARRWNRIKVLATISKRAPDLIPFMFRRTARKFVKTGGK